MKESALYLCQELQHFAGEGRPQKRRRLPWNDDKDIRGCSIYVLQQERKGKKHRKTLNRVVPWVPHEPFKENCAQSAVAAGEADD